MRPRGEEREVVGEYLEEEWAERGTLDHIDRSMQEIGKESVSLLYFHVICMYDSSVMTLLFLNVLTRATQNWDQSYLFMHHRSLLFLTNKSLGCNILMLSSTAVFRFQLVLCSNVRMQSPGVICPPVIDKLDWLYCAGCRMSCGTVHVQYENSHALAHVGVHAIDHNKIGHT